MSNKFNEPTKIERSLSKLRHGRDSAMIEAAISLGETGDEDVIEPLLDALGDSPNPAVLCAILRALTKIGLNDRTIFEISFLLTSRNDRVQKCAADFLAHLSTEALVKKCLIYYRDGNHKKDEWSFGSLLLGLNRVIEGIIPTLIKMFEVGSKEEQELAAWALPWFVDPETKTHPEIISVMLQIVNEDWFHPITQRRAADALGCSRGIRPMVALFWTMLRTKDAVLRWHAGDSLFYLLKRTLGRAKSIWDPLFRFRRFSQTRGRWKEYHDD